MSSTHFTSLSRTAASIRLAAVAACILSLAACTDRTANETAGQRVDAAVDKTEKATAAAANKAAELAEVARDKTRAYLTSPEVKQEVAAAKDALKNAGAGIVSSTDDAAVTASVSMALARDSELAASHIDVQTHAGVVRLAGPAPSAAAKARATDIAKAVSGVNSVDNQLDVKAM